MSELDKQMILDRIIKLLKEKNRTQKKLAAYLKISNTVVSQWKNGTCDSYTKHLSEIADFLEVSTDFLAYGRTDGLTEKETEMLLLFRKLSEHEQSKLIGQTEKMLELKEIKVVARKIARRTDGEAVRTDVTAEELAIMEQLPEETDF